MASDETVILPRDPAEIERVAAERVDDAVREHKGEGFANLLAENKRLREDSETKSALIGRLEHTLRQSRDECAGLRAEIERMTTPRMFRSLEDLRAWVAQAFEAQGCEITVPCERSRLIVPRKNGKAVTLVVRAASRGLGWVQRLTFGGLDEELAAVVADGGFSAANREDAWCVTLVDGGAS